MYFDINQSICVCATHTHISDQIYSFNAVMASQHTLASLNLLNSVAQARQNDIMQAPSSPVVDSDDEADAECPIFDQFYAIDGNESIIEMTNFTAVEFRKLYTILHPTMNANWNIGRGRRCLQKPMDVLFMAVTVLKHGGTSSTSNRLRLKE